MLAMSRRVAAPVAAFASPGRPQKITLGEVVRALDRDEALVECFRADGGACALTPRCRLKSRLFAAREAFLRQLDTTTLAECAYPMPPALAAAPA